MRNNDSSKLVIWLTGLSGAGKSTLAESLFEVLKESGMLPYHLDGDKLRHGLCSDLKFSAKDREENIRRAGEVAKLFFDAGHIVICSFISPFKADREEVKRLVGTDRFIEVFVSCPLKVCERRDVKGLYKKAREGQIKNFTGIDSPFEVPEKPDVVLMTAEESPQESLEKLLKVVESKISLRQNVEV